MSKHNVCLADIVEKTGAAKSVAFEKVREIQDVTAKLRILALNALIEAKRAGDAGRGFGVVADEVKTISQQVETLSKTLSSELGNQINQLENLTREMSDQSQGNRLIDLALNAVELIDRNLYERTCDVRWWATDSALVKACENQDFQACDFASSRLGVILDAYTVYIDLWLCDLEGNIIANGRPNKYNIIGNNVARENWFQKAKMLYSGSDFAVDDIRNEYLLNNAQVATYATGVRENGEENGRLIGILGIHFDWKPQAEAIVSGVRLSPEDARTSEVMLVDSKGLVIASSSGRGILQNRINLITDGKTAGYYHDASGKIVAFHKTPGYETYQGLGWYGAIIKD
jgi:Methyl-accepting chemotaxis protein (MCP) signalling domain